MVDSTDKRDSLATPEDSDSAAWMARADAEVRRLQAALAEAEERARRAEAAVLWKESDEPPLPPNAKTVELYRAFRAATIAHIVAMRETARLQARDAEMEDRCQQAEAALAEHLRLDLKLPRDKNNSGALVGVVVDDAFLAWRQVKHDDGTTACCLDNWNHKVVVAPPDA